MKKILAVVLALAMVLGLGSVAFAATSTEMTITGPNSCQKGKSIQLTANFNGDVEVVNWKVEGQQSSFTTISSSGLLTLAIDETGFNGELTVTATPDTTCLLYTSRCV